ncbi:MAG: hypothetical protein LUE90_08920 [Clostridiales bacterium]|nr:hypothetical protein [Clostridiales bacterium]
MRAGISTLSGRFLPSCDFETGERGFSGVEIDGISLRYRGTVSGVRATAVYIEEVVFDCAGSHPIRVGAFVHR